MVSDNVLSDSPASDAANAPVLRVRGLTKSFVGNLVLQDADLELVPGQVLGLVGENGAGKSTLMKILAGVHQADDGTVEIGGEQVAFSHPVQAQQAGLSTVFQEFNLLPERSVAENIWLGREPRRRGLVDTRAMISATDELLSGLGITGLRATRRVRSLSVAEQQVVEIAKAVSFDARIIQMDEPTAALADHEVELLYTIIRRLTERGVRSSTSPTASRRSSTSATPSPSSRTGCRSRPAPRASSTKAASSG